MEAAARKLGLELIVLRAGTTDREIDTAFATIAQQDGHALVVGVDPSFLDRRDHIIALAARHAIPAIVSLPSQAVL
jgi:putative tryptophan/tyrosine transport system substrate-binding protein